MYNVCNFCSYLEDSRKFWRSPSLEELKSLPCWNCKFLFDGDHYDEKLKRCPFCGNEAEFIYDDGGDSGDESYSVECTKCACDIGWYKTKKEASDAWNIRV